MDNFDVLINDFIQGDDFALEQILKNNKPLINQVVRKYYLIGADMEDLMQEGMIGLYRAVLTYDRERDTNFVSYARICIERSVLNAIKSASALKHSPLNNYTSIDSTESQDEEDEDERMGSIMPCDSKNPELILLQQEKYDKLFDKAVQNLSVFERNVLELYLEGMSYVEIARSLDKTPKSVDNALSRIKSKISQQKDDKE